MFSKAKDAPPTEQQQYQAIEQTLTRAGYDHEAYIEDRPKIGNGSLVFSQLGALMSNSTIGSVSGGGVGSSIGASSMYGGSMGSAGLQNYSPSFHGVGAPSPSPRRYNATIRSSTSSILTLGRQKVEPPVMILPHYNSPFEAIFHNQPDVLHFIGKDLRIGTICVSCKPGRGVMHFLVRTVLKFIHVDVPETFRTTSTFEQYRSFYPKKNDLLAMLHLALQQCLEAVPESAVSRHRVVRQQSAADHAVLVLDEPGWMHSPRYIASLVSGLEEVKQEGFTHVLRNLEAQMRPAALTVDVVIPDGESFTAGDQEKFWTFFNGLGDHVEAAPYFMPTPKKVNQQVLHAGIESVEHRNSVIKELISTELSYIKKMSYLVNVYMGNARMYTGPMPPVGKYEVRTIFSNVEQIVAANVAFVEDLQKWDQKSEGNLGEICKRHMKTMCCYRTYILGYPKALDMMARQTKRNVLFAKFMEACHEECIAREHDAKVSGLAKKVAVEEGAEEDEAEHYSVFPTVNNLLMEPNQRIAKYPLLFKQIIAGSPKDSPDVADLTEASRIASEICDVANDIPVVNSQVLLPLLQLIENCPADIVNQNRIIHAYLDGYETNLLTGEKGRPITLLLFSDRIMIVRRTKNGTGESLLRPPLLDNSGKPEVKSGGGGGGFMSKKEWKFMGWADILRLKMSCVEQTDPEGLFCITTRNHSETKDDPWETTRGILPEHFEKRDEFISKFYEAFSLRKAEAFGGSKHTARLHVTELELFCNVFTEASYRDFKFKGDVTLFYNQGLTQHPRDVSGFTRLPFFVGMIQSTEAGFRAVLRSKVSLNRAGDSEAAAEGVNKFMDADSFQIHITELVSNIQWTAYHFDPYENALLHSCRLYLDTDYLFKTASTFMKATTLRTKGLKKIRDSAASVTSSPSSYRNHHHGHGHSHSMSSPLTSPSGMMSLPSSPGGAMLGRSNTTNTNYSQYANHVMSPTNHTTGGNASGAAGGSSFWSGQGAGSMYIPPPMDSNNSNSNSGVAAAAPPLPILKNSHTFQVRRRADSSATLDSTTSSSATTDASSAGGEGGSGGGGGKGFPLGLHTLRSSVSAMNMLIPGRKKDVDEVVRPVEVAAMLIQRLEYQGMLDHQLLMPGPLTLSTGEKAIVEKLYSLVHDDFELLRMEVRNYGSAIIFGILKKFLIGEAEGQSVEKEGEEKDDGENVKGHGAENNDGNGNAAVVVADVDKGGYKERPIMTEEVVEKWFGNCLDYQKKGQRQEMILLKCQAFLDQLNPDARAILSRVISCYIRLKRSQRFDTALPTLTERLRSLIVSNQGSKEKTLEDGNKGDPIPEEAENSILFMEMWARNHTSLFPEDDRRGRQSAFTSASGRSTPSSPLSPSDTVYSNFSQSTAVNLSPTLSDMHSTESLSSGSANKRHAFSPPLSLDTAAVYLHQKSSSLTCSPRKIVSQDPNHAIAHQPQQRSRSHGRQVHFREDGDLVSSSESHHQHQQLQQQHRPLGRPATPLSPPPSAMKQTLSRMASTAAVVAAAEEEAAIMNLEQAKQSRDETFSMARQSGEDINLIKAQIEDLRESIAYEYRQMGATPTSPTTSSSRPLSIREEREPSTGAPANYPRRPTSSLARTSQHQESLDREKRKRLAETNGHGGLVRSMSMTQINHVAKPQSLGSSGLQEGYPHSTRTLDQVGRQESQSSVSSVSTFSTRSLSMSDSSGISSHNVVMQRRIRTTSQDRPLPLTPVEESMRLWMRKENEGNSWDQEIQLLDQLQLSLGNSPQDLYLQSRQEKDAEQKLEVHHGPTLLPPLMVEEYGDDEEESVREDALSDYPQSTEPLLTAGRNILLPSMTRSPQEQPQAFAVDLSETMKAIQEQVSFTAKRNLGLLDEFATAVEEYKIGFGFQWEVLASRYEELVGQLGGMRRVQVQLEQENEAMKDLVDEVMEENNVLLERFNEELEAIFEAMNPPCSLPPAECADGAEDLLQGLGVHFDKDQPPLPEIPSMDDLRCLEDDDASPSSPPLPPLPMGEGRVEVGERNGGESFRKVEQLEGMVIKAVQERARAEQQASRAVMRAGYYRDLLERHGVQVEDDVFL